MGVYEELQERGLIAQVTDEKEVREMVNSGKAIFYIGFDPTADSLHVGHFMALCLMKRLQMAGNRPIALMGGGTGMIGDPSGRTDLRKVLTVEEIDSNIACFKEQMSRFIDFSEGKAILVNNGDWLRNLNLMEFLREVGPHFSVNEMLRARCYVNRLANGLSFLEFSYMLMQGYDFYRLYEDYGCNMEFGGDDQWSNIIGGVHLTRKMVGKEVYGMTFSLLTTSEGKKMGKTQKGALWLDPNRTSPFDFFQYWRNVSDADVEKCLRMLTFLPMDEVKRLASLEGAEINKAKEILAYEVTKLVHGEEEAKKALDAARAAFSGQAVANVPTVELEKAVFAGEGKGLVSLIKELGLVTSNGDGFRTIEQGGLSLNRKKVEDPKKNVTEADFEDGELLIQKGKKKFLKVVLK